VQFFPPKAGECDAGTPPCCRACWDSPSQQRQCSAQWRGTRAGAVVSAQGRALHHRAPEQQARAREQPGGRRHSRPGRRRPCWLSRASPRRKSRCSPTPGRPDKQSESTHHGDVHSHLPGTALPFPLPLSHPGTPCLRGSSLLWSAWWVRLLLLGLLLLLGATPQRFFFIFFSLLPCCLSPSLTSGTASSSCTSPLAILLHSVSDLLCLMLPLPPCLACSFPPPWPVPFPPPWAQVLPPVP